MIKRWFSLISVRPRVAEVVEVMEVVEVEVVVEVL